MSIWIPKNPGEAIEMARLLNPNNPHELILLHAAFGHHFGGDMGLTMTQGYVLKGKPTLNADAMAGICRRSGLCRYIKIVVWDETRCVLETARTDEPQDVTHSFEFNMGMANAQGLTRNRNWSQMPRQMLRARALTLGLRASFPDAVAGIYSADEIADNTDMSDHERDVITAQALGTDMPSRAPRAQHYSQPPQSQPPQPQSERPQPQPERPQPQPPQQHRKVERPANRLHDFSSLDGMQKAVEAWGVDPIEASNATEERCPKPPSQLETHEREFFFYSAIASDHVRTNSAVVEGWWRAPLSQLKPHHESVAKQFPIVKFMLPKSFGPKMCYGAFMETLRVTNEAPDDLREKLLAILDQMEPTDWSAYDYAVNLVEEYKANAQ